jgi:SAM-dependent methyltransferase
VGEFSLSEVRTFYPADYYTHGISDVPQPKPSFLDRLRTHIAWWFDNGRDFHPNELPNHGGLVCDLGCGSGNSLRLFKVSGYQTVGVDPDPVARSIAADAGTILNGTAEDLPLDLLGKKFDVVLMSHALEHCIDPVKAISNAKKLLREDGTLVIEVPNNKALSFSIFRAFWPWTDIPRHLNFFSANSLLNLLQRNGLEIFNTIYVGYTIQFAPAWISKQRDIWKQIGSGRAPNFSGAAWAVLVRTALSQDKYKYASIRIHARIART